MANIADRVAVMYGGQMIETGDVDEIFYDPKHPYTWGLLSSMPDLTTSNDTELIAILEHHLTYFILLKEMHSHVEVNML